MTQTTADPGRRHRRRNRGPRSLPLLLALSGFSLLAVLAWAAPASAHDPIFLTEDQETPEEGPYLPDGTISFAVYGSLLAPGDTRGLEFDLRDGDDLYLSLLIPDLEPETLLADDQLPTMSLLAPDGTERQIGPDVREPFADPFSGTDYVTLFETVEPGVGGRHQLTVTGESATRFVVAVGTREEFFTPTERSGDRPSSFPGIAAPLNEWYTTPADGSEPVNGEVEADVDVDVDLIEEELAKLEDDETQQAVTEADREEGPGDTADQTSEENAIGEDEAGESSDGGSTRWVAPLAVIAAAGAGGGVLLRRRRTT